MAPSLPELARSCAHVQPLWAQLRLADRGRYLRRAAQTIVVELDELIDVVAQAQELRPAEAAGLELLPGIDALEWLAGEGADALRERRLGAPRATHPVTRLRVAWEPLGVVAIVGAPDAAFVQPLWQVGAALLAGNAVVLAPHPRTLPVAERIARLFARASLPEGLLVVAAEREAEPDPTGLSKVFAADDEQGRALAAACARAGIPAALDRGGGGAVLVLDDAPVGRAARGVVNAAFAAGGRGRGAAKRAWVDRRVADEWVAAVVSAAGLLGPVRAGDEASHAVSEALAAGAVLRCGGPMGGGTFAPAVIEGVTPEMALGHTRVAAPVLAVTRVDSTGEAIAAANVARIREGASVWTGSRHEGARIARELHHGPTWLNDHHVGPAVPSVPWALGVGGVEGVRAYAQPRAITWDPPTGGGLWWGPYDERYERAARAVARLRSVRDRDRERAWREGALPLARVAARALRGRGGER